MNAERKNEVHTLTFISIKTHLADMIFLVPSCLHNRFFLGGQLMCDLICSSSTASEMSDEMPADSRIYLLLTMRYLSTYINKTMTTFCELKILKYHHSPVRLKTLCVFNSITDNSINKLTELDTCHRQPIMPH